MTPDQRTRRAAAIQANSELYRRTMALTSGAIITAFAAGIMWSVALSAEHQLKREALENQEAHATWVK